MFVIGGSAHGEFVSGLRFVELLSPARIGITQRGDSLSRVFQHLHCLASSPQALVCLCLDPSASAQTCQRERAWAPLALKITLAPAPARHANLLPSHVCGGSQGLHTVKKSLFACLFPKGKLAQVVPNWLCPTENAMPQCQLPCVLVGCQHVHQAPASKL